MNWLSRFFPAKPSLTPQQAERLAAWQALPDEDPDRPLDDSRYVVVDVETSGLNMSKDRLIAIGAVALQAGRIQLADSLEVVLQQKEASNHGNILIHGISGTAQRQGVPPIDALLAFLEYLGKSPLVAFHVAFDETMIKRALRKELGLDFMHPWMDLAYLAPALYPRLAHRYRALDDWAGYFSIQNYARHNALADALSTAQLFLKMRGKMAEQELDSFRRLQEVDKAQRWVNRVA